MTINEAYLEAKRALFEAAYGELNERQREAVFTVNGPLLVLAGAGSGKTTVLVKRIGFLVRYGNAYHSQRVPVGVTQEKVDALKRAACMPKSAILPILDEFADEACEPYRVLAITFTNKAANEIKTRLEGMFPEHPEAVGDMMTGTFHSVCVRILRRYGELQGYRSGFSIYDTDDSKKAYAEAMKRCGIDEKLLPVKTVMNAVSRAKDNLSTPETFEAEAGVDFRKKQIARVYGAYQALLRESNAMDFDDLIMQTVLLLKNHREVAEAYQRRFKYVCVDEYQDTNPAQFELTRLLAAGYENLMVVGDDDQSIYKFRGATIENILSFDKTYPRAKVIKLEQNYRSTQNILDAANAVIAKNEGRMGKTLWTSAGEGEQIKLLLCEDQNAEARRVVDLVNRKVAKGEAKYRDFAILYRMNAQSQSIEKAFARSATPYRMLGGTRFSDREEIRDAVAYLQLINNREDNLRLNRIINKPARKIGAKTLEAISEIAQETGLSQFEVIRRSPTFAALKSANAALQDFADLIEGLAQDLERMALDVFFDCLLERTGYRTMWELKGESEAERLENLDEFKSQIIEYMSENESPTLTGFLEETALVADVDRYDETADAVVMMTIHSAKGLEFPIVFLPGMEEGIFPGMQTIDAGPSEMEEERRLAYVAITRAKKELFVLHTSQRLLYGQTRCNSLSRFVSEIPSKLVDGTENTAQGSTPISGRNSTYGSNFGGFGTVTRTYYSERGSAASASAKKVPVSPSARPSVSPLDAPARVSNAPMKPRASVIFAPGDRVRHMTFGVGEILSVKPMGADQLYEIAFETVGTKKLMASYAKLNKV